MSAVEGLHQTWAPNPRRVSHRRWRQTSRDRRPLLQRRRCHRRRRATGENEQGRLKLDRVLRPFDYATPASSHTRRPEIPDQTQDLAGRDKAALRPAWRAAFRSAIPLTVRPVGARVRWRVHSGPGKGVQLGGSRWRRERASASLRLPPNGPLEVTCLEGHGGALHREEHQIHRSVTKAGLDASGKHLLRGRPF